MTGNHIDTETIDKKARIYTRYIDREYNVWIQQRRLMTRESGNFV